MMLKFKDNVRIISGFYEGITGIVTDWGINGYEVEFVTSMSNSAGGCEISVKRIKLSEEELQKIN